MSLDSIMSFRDIIARIMSGDLNLDDFYTLISSFLESNPELDSEVKVSFLSRCFDDVFSDIEEAVAHRPIIDGPRNNWAEDKTFGSEYRKLLILRSSLELCKNYYEVFYLYDEISQYAFQSEKSIEKNVLTKWRELQHHKKEVGRIILSITEKKVKDDILSKMNNDYSSENFLLMKIALDYIKRFSDRNLKLDEEVFFDEGKEILAYLSEENNSIKSSIVDKFLDRSQKSESWSRLFKLS